MNYRSNHNAVPTVAGAVIGGVVGNKVFKNTPLKGFATVAGAVVGGAIAHDITRHRH